MDPADHPSLKLDFLIPASPQDGFYSQIAFFRLALDRLGGIYKEARLVAVFGDETLRPLPARWRPYFERIDIVWAEPAEFKSWSYFAQVLKRFEAFRPDADLVLFCDADTLPMRGLEWLIAEIVLRPALAGVIAHFHFPWDFSTTSPARDWRHLAGAILGRDIALPYFYSLRENTEENRCPFYINYGFVAGSPAIFATFYKRYRDMLPVVHGVLRNYFSAQVTVPLAAADLGLQTLALPMRYNYPNDPLVEKHHPLEKYLISVFHYLRTDGFDRQEIFTSRQEFDSFLSLPLSGGNQVFQEFVKDLSAGSFPFECEGAGNAGALRRVIKTCAAGNSETARCDPR